MHQTLTLFLLIIFTRTIHSQADWHVIQLKSCDQSDLSIIESTYNKAEELILEFNRLSQGGSVVFCLTNSTKDFKGSCEKGIIEHPEGKYIYSGPVHLDSEQGGTKFAKVKKVYDFGISHSDQSNFQGSLLWNDGRFFTGIINPLGRPVDGVMIYDKSWYYIGELNNEIPHGRGKKFFQGKISEGTWVNGALKEPDLSDASVVYWKSPGGSNDENPNTSIKNVQKMIEPYLGSSDTGIQRLLSNSKFQPTFGDFRMVFQASETTLASMRTNYITKLQYFLSNTDLSSFNTMTYDISSVNVKGYLSGWSGNTGKPRPVFNNENDVFVKVSFYNPVLLSTFDLYFYQVSKEDNLYKIFQLQFFRI